MNRTNEKAAGVLDTLATAQEITHVDSTAEHKKAATMAAQFALKGHCMRVNTRQDGATSYTVSRWNQSRAFTHWNDVLAFLTQIGGQPAANSCAGCTDNFPLPEAMDFFDRIVVADYVSRRTACTLCPAGDKPCLPKGGAA